MSEEFPGWPSMCGQPVVIIHEKLEKIAESLGRPVLFEGDYPYIWFNSENVGLINILGDPWCTKGVSEAFVDSKIERTKAIDVVTSEVLKKLDSSIAFEVSEWP